MCEEHLEQRALETTQVLASLVADDTQEQEPTSREFFPDDKSHLFLDLNADIQPGGDATYERYYRTGHMNTDSETDEEKYQHMIQESKEDQKREEEDIHFSILMHASGLRLTNHGSRLSAVYFINKDSNGQPKRLTEEYKREKNREETPHSKMYADGWRLSKDQTKQSLEEDPNNCMTITAHGTCWNYMKGLST